MTEEIFVFGSNLAGVHGAGAARFALSTHGAVWGEGVGHFGTSYAIPTKDENIETLPLDRIKPYVEDFARYAKENPELSFRVTRIGCGLAGYKDSDIVDMFRSIRINDGLPRNVKFFDVSWDWAIHLD